MDLVKLGFVLILIGFLIVFIATLLPMLMAIHREGAIEIGGGGCIILLFIPICFGYGEAHLVLPLIIVAMILTLAVLIIGFLMFREARKGFKGVDVIH